jgi:hypothetical protein
MNPGQPTFMRDNIPIRRPELGDIELGAPVVVHLPSKQGRYGGRYVPAQVVSKARIWVMVEETGREHPNSWRLRLDTQHDGSRDHHRTSFRTPDQQLHEEAHVEAYRYLGEQGIRLEYSSPWRKTPWDTIRLARMLWRVNHDVDD